MSTTTTTTTAAAAAVAAAVLDREMIRVAGSLDHLPAGETFAAAWNARVKKIGSGTGNDPNPGHTVIRKSYPATADHGQVYYEQGKLDMAIQTYQEAITREPNFPEAYNNLGNALREANRPDEAIACYTMCIQLQFARPHNAALARALQANPQGAAMQQAQRLSVAYNNLGGLLKMQVGGRLYHSLDPVPFNPTKMNSTRIAFRLCTICAARSSHHSPGLLQVP